ncbi:MAG: hypothetical protein IT472_09670 [Thermomonas sp.]|uniref:PepSY domain-containing protein n=1 Tax=Thermomonas sp. TaxID=1971895 RepID=UPI002616A3A4|nr:hypothetical protein [Thermomonas sp.]MCC7097431.1 hypothetical protein [Thermomonas sp.]
MPRHLRTLSSLTAAALLGLVPSVQAQQAPPQGRGHGRQAPTPDWARQQEPTGDNFRGGQQERRDSASDAVRRVERDTRGEVISVERVQYDGQEMHRVKVVDDSGRVRIFMQDSRNGRNRRPTNPQHNNDD